jgi:hypothetical protein
MSKLCDLQIHINDEETFFLYEVYTLKNFIIVNLFSSLVLLDKKIMKMQYMSKVNLVFSLIIYAELDIKILWKIEENVKW